VVPSLTKKTVGISGALSAVADVGDVISEAAYIVTSEDRVPTICNLSRRLSRPNDGTGAARGGGPPPVSKLAS
jgi:hypothetical protein